MLQSYKLTLHTRLKNQSRTWPVTHNLLPGMEKPPYAGYGPPSVSTWKMIATPGQGTGRAWFVPIARP